MWFLEGLREEKVSIFLGPMLFKAPYSAWGKISWARVVSHKSTYLLNQYWGWQSDCWLGDSFPWLPQILLGRNSVPFPAYLFQLTHFLKSSVCSSCHSSVNERIYFIMCMNWQLLGKKEKALLSEWSHLFGEQSLKYPWGAGTWCPHELSPLAHTAIVKTCFRSNWILPWNYFAAPFPEGLE